MAAEGSRSASHKGEKVRSYTTDFNKIEVIVEAEINGNKAAARKYNVAPKSVREWRSKKEKFENLCKTTTTGGKRFRLDAGGRNITSAEIEERLLEWIHKR